MMMTYNSACLYKMFITLNNCSALFSSSSDGNVVNGFTNGSLECVINSQFHRTLSKRRAKKIKMNGYTK